MRFQQAKGHIAYHMRAMQGLGIPADILKKDGLTQRPVGAKFYRSIEDMLVDLKYHIFIFTVNSVIKANPIPAGIDINSCQHDVDEGLLHSM